MNRFKYLFTLCLLTLFLPSPFFQFGAQRSDTAKKIETLVSSHVRPNEPGMAVIVTRKGQTLFRAAYGLANMGQNLAMRPEMIFQIASLTKSFTAAAILSLVEQGKLSLNDSIHSLLPQFPYQGAQVRVEHLLTHTSGIPNYTDFPDWQNNWHLERTVDELIASFAHHPLEFSPGSNWRYSNSNYILLGALIEQISGMSYDSYLSKYLTRPIKLENTRYTRSLFSESSLVVGYLSGTHTFFKAKTIHPSQYFAAAGILSTVDDLASWFDALSRQTVLSKESLDRSWSPYPLPHGLSSGYGFGWMVGRIVGQTLIEHGGRVSGFCTYMAAFPQSGVFAAVLMNRMAEYPDQLTVQLAMLAAGLKLEKPKAISLSAKDLEAYCGRYEYAPGDERQIWRQQNRLLTARGQGPITPLLVVADNECRFSDGLTAFRFERDKRGRIRSFVQQPRRGPEQRAVRQNDEIRQPPPAEQPDGPHTD